MCRLVIAFLFFLSCITLNAQVSFQKRFGSIFNDEGRSIQQISDGGYIVTGTVVFGYTSYDIFLLKTDANGDSVWIKTFNVDSSDQRAFCVRQTSDSGYIVVGSTGNSPNSNSFVIRTDKNGDTIWTRVYSGSEISYSVCETSDHGFLIIGRCNSNLGGDMFAMKIDFLGDILWTKSYGGIYYDEALNLCATPDSGFIIVGSTLNFGIGSTDILTVKINSIGDTIWTRTFGNTLSDFFPSVQNTLDSNFIISASTSSAKNENHLLKIDNSGNLIWQKTFSDSACGLYINCCQTNDSGFLLTGSFGDDLMIIKTDKMGDTLFTRTIRQHGSVHGYCITPTIDAGFIITGSMDDSDSLNQDIYIVKENSSGYSGCYTGRAPIDTSTVLWTSSATNLEVVNISVNNATDITVNNNNSIYYSDVCSTIGINDFQHSPYVNIFPNPLTDFFTISFDKIEKIKYSIIDISGKLIYVGNFEGEYLIIELNRSPGIYFLSVQSEAFKTVSKLVLE